MKNSTIILLNAIFMSILCLIGKHNGHMRIELLYFTIALCCTYFIVKAIEDK